MTGWQLFQAAVMWGPGILILAGIFVLVRRPPEFIGQFIGAQQSQAVAMEKMATAVEHATRRDNQKLDEILVGIQCVLDRQDELERRLPNGSG
jgi:hypothetical protein